MEPIILSGGRLSAPPPAAAGVSMGGGWQWGRHSGLDKAFAPTVTVGEEDEVSIREAAEAVVEAMDFRGEITVSFGSGGHWSLPE